MSMDHKAFAFDWNSFERDLLPILIGSLASGDGESIRAFIQEHRKRLLDPYEGNPLPDDWISLLETGDVQELSDFALTLYYHPSEDQGVGPAWSQLVQQLPTEIQASLLGDPIGTTTGRFDPGRMGSYFQTPEQVQDSIRALSENGRSDLAHYRRLLEECKSSQLGLYRRFSRGEID
jgi:hypothetical protein